MVYSFNILPFPFCHFMSFIHYQSAVYLFHLLILLLHFCFYSTWFSFTRFNALFKTLLFISPDKSTDFTKSNQRNNCPIKLSLFSSWRPTPALDSLIDSQLAKKSSTWRLHSCKIYSEISSAGIRTSLYTPVDSFITSSFLPTSRSGRSN